MFTSLMLGAALTAPGAPVPPDAVPSPTGPAPHVAFFRADQSGHIWVQVLTYTQRKVTRNISVVENGKLIVKKEEVEIQVPSVSRKQLGDMGAKFTTADGAVLAADDAVKRIKDGSVVLVSADGKPVHKAWLKTVNADTIVIASDSLATGTIQNTAPQPPGTQAPRLVLLAADMDGKLRLAFNPNPQNDNSDIYGRSSIVRVNVNGVVQQQIQIGSVATPSAPTSTTGTAPSKLLEDVKFDAYDLTGKVVPKAEALKQLKAGGMVLIAGDNRLPAAEYLKPFKGNLLVLVSSELIGVPNGAISKPGVVRPLPIAPVGGVAVPAVQLKPAIAPAIIAAPAIKPAVAVPANKPAVAPPAKPGGEKAPAKPAVVPKPIKN